jgi:hypothetical protein
LFSQRDAGNADAFIAAWLAGHPSAIATPICEQTLYFPLHAPVPREVYVWIADGRESLNVALVRGGYYAAGTMVDMLERDLRIGQGRQLPGVPEENRPHRLIADSDYAQRMREIVAAEKQSKKDLKGIWSRPPTQHAFTQKQAQRAAFPVRELFTVGVLGHRQNDSEIYCLLGGDAWLMGLWPVDPPAAEEHARISQWLAEHPEATAIPISTQAWKDGPGPSRRGSYVWIQDAGDSLNVYLVRQGLYRAELLRDMVEGGAAHEALANAVDAPRRLVTDPDYAARMQQAISAEADARRAGRGIWSPAGMKYRSLPTDEYMLSEYRRNKPWFQRITALVTSDSRLAAGGGDREALRKAGVPERRIQEYVSLLEQLEAHSLWGVDRIGKTAVITAEIAYGVMLNSGGVSKGYVFLPTDPRPVVADLDAPYGGDSEIRYRPVADGWYLFEQSH